jgi:hypothetical protein
MSAPAFTFALAAVLMLSATARSEDVLFRPETAGCYVGAEIAPAAGAAPYRTPAVAVTAIRLQRGHPQLALEEEQTRPAEGGRLINLRVIATFADAGKDKGPKRYANGLWDALRCSADVCDAGNYRVERQADGSVLLRMTGGLNIGGGPQGADANRRLPDGRVYRLVARPMEACR